MNRFFAALILVIGVLPVAFGQIVGGRDNGEMSPKTVEPSKLSPGAVVSDVNILNGEYTSTIPLGSISTPNGVAYSLSLDYSSNISIGTTAPVCSGIPYGEGWNLSVPTISVESDVFHKYVLRTEGLQMQPCGSTAGAEGSQILNYDGVAAPLDPLHKFTGQDNGDLYWFAPQLSIPGVASGRLVFKYLDESTAQKELVFGLNGFESPVEVRMYNRLQDSLTLSSWTVTLADGTKYWFDLLQSNYQAPTNTRVLSYDYCNFTSSTNALAVANPQNADEGSYMLGANNIEKNVLNNILPKVSNAVWYCTKITNTTIQNEEVVLEYDKFGKFNYFQEFAGISGDYADNKVDPAINGEFNAYKDVLLKKAVAKIESKPSEIIELDYKTLQTLITANPTRLIDFNAAQSGRLDSLYSWRRIDIDNNSYASGFTNWTRYSHARGVDGTDVYGGISTNQSYNVHSTNPFLYSTAASPSVFNYRRTAGLSDSYSLDFSDGFLESQRISYLNMIPGDIYEVRTIINNTRGTVDVAIVTGDLNTTPASSTSTYPAPTTGDYSTTQYDDTRGIEIFSTFNMAFKWYKPLASNYTNQVKTSNFFVMPNVPALYKGFNIQVGPGNSDVDYSTPPEGVWAGISELRFDAKDAFGFMPVATNNPNNKLFKSAAPIPHNFGNGFPWSMVTPMYERMEPYNSQDSDTSMFQCWYMNSYLYSQNGNKYNKHRPTTLGVQKYSAPHYPSVVAELQDVELIRYTRNPYMLQGVRVYRINNGNESTGKQLISHKQLHYKDTLKDLVENFDYINYEGGSTPIKYDNTRKRIVVFLSKVAELPLNATMYAANYGLAVADTGKVLTTYFGYADINTTSLTSVFEVRGENIHVLSSIRDHLGGRTTIEYQPISNSAIYNNYNPERSNFINYETYSSYGNGKLWTVRAIVKKVNREQQNSTWQTWQYVFSTPMFKNNQFQLDSNHFQHTFVQARTYGYKKATIINPLGDSTHIEHYGSVAGALDYLCFGKVKSIKEEVNDSLKSETVYTYDITLAFEHGAIRPSFKKTHKTYDPDMTSVYLYEDYYLNQSAYSSLQENLSQLKTYEDGYTYTSDAAREQPKMLEGHFYPELLAENNNNAYLFNSYFVKLVSESTKEYERGQYKMPAAPAACVDRNGNVIPCPDIIVVEPSSCSSTLSTVDRYIEIKKEYTYYEADHKGKALGRAFHDLFAIDPDNPKSIVYSTYGMGSGGKNQGNILLKHEPSWQMATVKTSSPQQGTAYTENEFFYFYDLANRYDRHWYLYDIVSNPKFTVAIYNGDTIAVNNIVSGVERANNYSLPRYEGLESSRTYNTRSLAYQKMSASKNASDAKPLIRSEYYHFDNSWTYAIANTYQPVYLRNAIVQLDTIASNAGNLDFRTNRIDRDNKYILDFKAITAGGQPFGKTYIYSALLPFDALTTKTVKTRNRLLLPEIMENQNGLQTRYYIATSITAGGVMTDLGLVKRITIGYGRTDSLSSKFDYNNQGLISKLTEPIGRYLDYEYDDYLRLEKTTENGTRILSEQVYSYWDHVPGVSFDSRTDQNNILTYIYNSATTNDKEILKAFIDPLGREQSVLQAYYDLSSTLVKVHSPTKVYDNLNRLQKTYKSFAGSGSTLNRVANTTTAFVELLYEDKHNRPIKTANYGEAIGSSTHTVRNEYKLVNGVVAYCDLGLSNEDAKVMMSSSGSGGSFYFLRQTTTDQDNKQSVTYTNAFGQLAASMTYTTAGVKAVTVFGYDSYGNVNKVINPNKQLTTYLYNILGQQVMETTVDGGTKRYMYNKLGLISVEQDANERSRTVSGTASPRYRVYKYDAYGKITSIGLMNVPGSVSAGFCDALYYGNTSASPYFLYTFSNSSTYDWMCTFKYGHNIVTMTPAFFTVSQPEKTFAYGTTPLSVSLGKLIQEDSYNNAGTKIHKNVYTYDILGHVTSQLSTFSPIDAEGASQLIVSKIDYPAYNYRGSVLEEKADVNNDGTTDLHLFYGYDRLNRPSTIRAAMGSVTTAADATLLVSYEYDVNDATKLVKKKHHIDDNTALSRLAMEFIYSYDIRNRLTDIEAKNGTTTVADYGLFYDGNNPVDGAQTVLNHQNWNGNINGTLMRYNFSTAENVVGNFNQSTLYGYQYDLLNRLVKADAAIGDFITENATLGLLIGDEDYTYDKIGNITSLKRQLRNTVASPYNVVEQWNYVYQSGTNRLTGVTGVGSTTSRSYTYDANGNLLTDNSRSITQTQYGRRAYAFTINKGTDVIDYLYDTEDQRIFKRTNATDNALDREEYYLQDLFGKTIAIRELQNGQVSWEYYIPGRDREMTIRPTPAQAPGANTSNTAKRVGFTQTSAYMHDHLGNTRISYTAQSWDAVNLRVKFSVTYVADYSPYGKIVREFIDGEKAKYLTTGHERDNETGLDYRGARYYDSDIARFLGLDPLAAKYPNFSAYNYVAGNPIIYIDPNGKEITNPYSEHKDNQTKIDELNKKIQKAEEEENNKERKKLTRERNALQNGLDNYNKVESLIAEFKAAVGNDEFERLNSLTFNGQEIDIPIYLQDKPVGEKIPEDGNTEVPYSTEIYVVTKYGSKESTQETRPVGIKGNTIKIVLYVHNLRTLANEFGDADFGVNAAQRNVDQQQKNVEYDSRATTQYSRAYEKWVMKEEATQPKPGDF